MAARPVAIRGQRDIRHGWSKVGPADADIDHIGEVGRAHVAGDGFHPGQRVEHLGHHILPVDHDRTTIKVAQRRVQDGPPFGFVDLRTSEHRIPALGNLRLLGKGDQHVHRARIYLRFGVVEQHVERCQAKILCPVLVRLEHPKDRSIRTTLRGLFQCIPHNFTPPSVLARHSAPH